MARQFGIFAKYWTPGQVKTRLAADVGDEAAALLHRACLETLLRRFWDLDARRVLAFTPAGRAADFAALVESLHSSGGALCSALHWQLEPQSSGDLGAKMDNYFKSAFATGMQRVVLIGSDSPTLPESFVVDAFDRLAENDAVLGPTGDGGYYLIGLSRLVPRLFDKISWSTSAVWPQTLDRLQAVLCSHHVLPLWDDVDTLADLARLRTELAGDPREEFSALRRVAAAF
jgi:uncharacterized protein